MKVRYFLSGSYMAIDAQVRKPIELIFVREKNYVFFNKAFANKGVIFANIRETFTNKRKTFANKRVTFAN